MQYFIAENTYDIMIVSSIKFVGMRVLRTGLNSPVSLTVAGDNIFWMEAISNAIYWTNFKNIFSNHKDVAFSEFV